MKYPPPLQTRLYVPGVHRTSSLPRLSARRPTAAGGHGTFGSHMSTRKRTIVGIIVVIAVVASVTMVALSANADRAAAIIKVTKEPLKAAKIATAGDAAAVVGETAAVVAASAALPVAPSTAPVSVRPVPPAELATWFSLTESQRLDLVTDLSRNPTLTPEVVAFLRSVIQDRARGIVTRNNAANALVGQEIKDPTLAAVFQRMVDDVSETEKWRDYSLQFLAVSVDWSNDPEAMAATIWQMATTGPGSIPGTALLHLNYIGGTVTVRKVGP